MTIGVEEITQNRVVVIVVDRGGVDFRATYSGTDHVSQDAHHFVRDSQVHLH